MAGTLLRQEILRCAQNDIGLGGGLFNLSNPQLPESPALGPRPTLAAVIPALNEEAAIGDLVAELLAVAARPDLAVAFDAIYVVDNGSDDATAARAEEAGAVVVAEPRRGYGRACLSGVLAAEGVDLIVLLDGDRSDTPDELPLLLAPLLAGEADLVVGSRVLGHHEPGSLTGPQRFGNWFAARVLGLLFGVRVTDIGPFRVIRRDVLLNLGMREMTYGWSVEMIARAAKAGLRVCEVPVTYRRRAGGVSKVSGDLRASVRAGFRIIATIVRVRRNGRATGED
ncbi:MAG: hypothetical protein AVDCRST_MAG73-4070 [uncultured Thermomicrobiales bacterium]|uniref:Glycosyltransferase 2-like domain-containing protein n=1 Tax=uncultured Thermomicrobiales bacterium TaxID=1645740 RepID=A0A6J4V0Z3_9BACT|nr:MAG: hypothetical protein AVDCRST_MAG73-4070 [uncultured Thermomicrobiales bacterium]